MEFIERLFSSGDEEIERLRSRVEELEEEKKDYKSRYEAEKSRRSELSTEKQDAEKRLNRAKDRIRSLESQDNQDQEKEETKNQTVVDMSCGDFETLLNVLSGVDEGVTVVVSEWEDLQDKKSLRDIVGSHLFSQVRGNSNFCLFCIPGMPPVKVGLNVDFTYWSDEISVRRVKDFYYSRKTYVSLSAGDSTIYCVEGSELVSRNTVKTRVNREHSKGGFSQSRFEEKRDSQIEKHFDEVKNSLNDFSSCLLLGQDHFSSYFGRGIDGRANSDKTPPDSLYGLKTTYYVDSSCVLGCY